LQQQGNHSGADHTPGSQDEDVWSPKSRHLSWFRLFPLTVSHLWPYPGQGKPTVCRIA
jgi:hypothetical protein